MNIYQTLGVVKKTAKPGDLMMAQQQKLRRLKAQKTQKAQKLPSKASGSKAKRTGNKPIKQLFKRSK